MEYMDGGTLGDLLKVRPRIPEPYIAQMARQVSFSTPATGYMSILCMLPVRCGLLVVSTAVLPTGIGICLEPLSAWLPVHQ